MLVKKEPKFRMIETYIKEQIVNDNLKVGDQIMTEEQLCKHFDVSRMTVNKALTNLTELGYINRIPGKGSFVTTPHVSKSLTKRSSFTEDMKEIGLIAGSKLLSYQILHASEIPHIATLLELSGDEMIHYFIRLRTGNDVPIAISYTYISAKVIPAIDVNSLNHSFYEFLDQKGITRSILNWEFKAVIPSEKQRKLLKITNNDAAILKVCHTTHCVIKENDHVPFEYVETCYNSDLYSYHFQTDERQ